MKFEFSAGGIVYKKDEDKVFILLSKHSGHHGWVFPKGHIDREHGEKKEDAATREVKEETGVIAEIENEMPPITYWNALHGERSKKTVYYYIMRHLSGDISQHDDEMEEVEWLSIDEVSERLTYESDKGVWEVASKLIRGK